MQLDHYRLLREAEDKKDAFAKLVEDVAYEEKGILYSEMFFLSLAVSQFEPLRMVESGRARGQSTELLAKLYPDMPIISVEFDENSPDVAVAKKRLAPYKNVECRFGDARELLPELSKAGDIALVDGPKSFRGLKLVFNLLATRKFDLVFLHDVNVGTPDRAFLEKHLPSTCYSDDPEYAEICHDLDERAKALLPAESTYEATKGKFGYGFSLACLPYDARINYGSLVRKAGLASFKQNLARTFGRK